MTTALITGASGQDGTILSRMLTREGINVIGLVKPGTDTSHLIRYAPQVEIVECDLGDSAGLTQIAIDTAPDFIYNLGGFTAPGDSWDHQEEVQRINVGAVEAFEFMPDSYSRRLAEIRPRRGLRRHPRIRPGRQP